MTSRETSEYFMPSLPIEMPSEIVMVLKMMLLPPAASTPMKRVVGSKDYTALAFQGSNVDQALLDTLKLHVGDRREVLEASEVVAWVTGIGDEVVQLHGASGQVVRRCSDLFGR